MNLRMGRIVVGSLAALVLGVTGACAGDADEVTTETTALADSEEASIAAYCGFAEELDSLQAPPSQEQLDRIVELAPAEIKDDVETLVQGVAEENFEDPDVQAAGERLEAWDADNCPEDESDVGEGADDSDAGESSEEGEGEDADEPGDVDEPDGADTTTSTTT